MSAVGSKPKRVFIVYVCELLLSCLLVCLFLLFLLLLFFFFTFRGLLISMVVMGMIDNSVQC